MNGLFSDLDIYIFLVKSHCKSLMYLNVPFNCEVWGSFELQKNINFEGVAWPDFIDFTDLYTYLLTSTPSSVLSRIIFRSMSPLDTCNMSNDRTMRSDTVPFPDPGAPMIRARSLFAAAIIRAVKYLNLKKNYYKFLKKFVKSMFFLSEFSSDWCSPSLLLLLRIFRVGKNVLRLHGTNFLFRIATVAFATRKRRQELLSETNVPVERVCPPKISKQTDQLMSDKPVLGNATAEQVISIYLL